MTNRRLILCAVLGAACSLLSCESMNDILSNVDKPTARIAGVRLADLDTQAVTMEFDVEVANPYSFALPVAALDYRLASAGRQILDGDSAGGTSIPARGRSVVPMTARLPFSQVLSVLSGVRPGAVVPYEADLGISLDVPGGDRLRLPLQKSGEFPIPTPPRVSIENLQWEELSLNAATARLDLGIENLNDFPVDLSTLRYAFSLAGYELADTSIAKPLSFGANQRERTSLVFSFKPSQLGFAAFNLLRGDEAGYQLGGDMLVQTPFGPVNLPFNSTGTTPLAQ